MQTLIFNLFQHHAVKVGTVIGCISSLVSPRGDPFADAIFGMICTSLYSPFMVIVPVLNLSQRLYPRKSIKDQIINK